MTIEQILDAIKNRKPITFLSEDGIGKSYPEGIYLNQEGDLILFRMREDLFAENAVYTFKVENVLDPNDADRINAEIDLLRIKAQKDIDLINRNLSESISKLTARAG